MPGPDGIECVGDDATFIDPIVEFFFCSCRQPYISLFSYVRRSSYNLKFCWKNKLFDEVESVGILPPGQGGSLLGATCHWLLVEPREVIVIIMFADQANTTDVFIDATVTVLSSWGAILAPLTGRSLTGRASEIESVADGQERSACS